MLAACVLRLTLSEFRANGYSRRSGSPSNLSLHHIHAYARGKAVLPILGDSHYSVT